MKLTVESLKAAYLKKGYKWFDNQPIITGIRTSIDVPNAFNDLLVLVLPYENKLVGITATTDPGTYYLNKPMNVKGTSVVVPDQYLQSYKVGYHGSGINAHKALVLAGRLKVWRDNNLNNNIDPDKTKMYVVGPESGVNIHTTGNYMIPFAKIDKWGAGCQVASNSKSFQQLFMSEIEKFEKTHKDFLYSYALLMDSDI